MVQPTVTASEIASPPSSIRESSSRSSIALDQHSSRGSEEVDGLLPRLPLDRAGQLMRDRLLHQHLGVTVELARRSVANLETTRFVREHDADRKCVQRSPQAVRLPTSNGQPLLGVLQLDFNPP